MRRNFSENLITLVLVSFLFASLFGIGIGMEMKDGQMSPCPFATGQASTCQMSAAEHIGQWQQMLVGMPTKANLLELAPLILIIFVILSAKLFPKIKQNELTVRLTFYFKTAATKIFDSLLLAFSDGILNPKIYEPARV